MTNRKSDSTLGAGLVLAPGALDEAGGIAGGGIVSPETGASADVSTGAEAAAETAGPALAAPLAEEASGGDRDAGSAAGEPVGENSDAPVEALFDAAETDAPAGDMGVTLAGQVFSAPDAPVDTVDQVAGPSALALGPRPAAGVDAGADAVVTNIQARMDDVPAQAASMTPDQVTSQAVATSQNVVIIAIDDLAQWVAPGSNLYGQVKTPNMDRLVGDGVTFTNAYTPVAICNPARTSVLSGQMPDTTGVHFNRQNWEDYVSPQDTWPAHFLEAGYDVSSFGKLFHLVNQNTVDQLFTEYQPLSGYYNGAPATEYVQPLPDELTEADMADTIAVDAAIDYLDRMSGDTPFMMNVGLVKPHVNWVVPQEYFDLHPIEDIVVPGLDGDDLSDVPDFIVEQLPSRGKSPTSVQEAKEFMQGYLASVSYADAQIGRFLDALEAAGQYDDTHIVLWSDHGYHLGDHDDTWGKFTLWEEATKVPLVIKAAGNANAGTEVDDVVNLIDIFPTICDLTGRPQPDHLEGDSLMSLVYGTGPAEGNGMSVTWMYGSAMLRKGGWAYIHYEDGSEELYHMINDPQQKTNLAGIERYADIVDGLRADLFDAAQLVTADADVPAVGGAGTQTFLLSDPNDRAIGGAGDDIYFVNDSSVVITEDADGGRDTVFTDVDFVLPDNVEMIETKGYSSGEITVWGNAADNVVTLADSRQTAYGGAGNDTIFAAGSYSTAFGEAGNDRIIGGILDDFLDGGEGNDAIYARSGDDILLGRAGNDTLVGGDGASQLFGGGGSDTLTGGKGDETLNGGQGGDYLDGGAGRDVADYAGALTGVVADLGDSGANAGDAAGDTYVSIENLSGSALDDVLIGDGRDNRIWGGAGNDRLFGGDGTNNLYGQDGDDYFLGGVTKSNMYGGNGRDTVSYRADTLGIYADLQDQAANSGAAAQDTYVDIEQLQGGAGHDYLFGDTRDNALFGGDKADRLTGREGDDRLVGGGGSDLFVFLSGFDNDRIDDFEAGLDRLLLRGFGFGTSQEAIDAFVQVGSNLVLTMGDDSLTILNTTVSDLLLDNVVV